MRDTAALVFCGVVLFNLGLGWSRGDEGPDGGHRHLLNDGYSLLYHLCNEEKQLELILLVKTTPPDVADFAKQVSKTAKDQVATLDQLREHAPFLRLDQESLPQIELDVRASIKEDKQHQMLFGNSGTDFARYLLLSQIEASTYGMHLAKVLAQDESSPARARTLATLSGQWSYVRDHAFHLLKNL